MLFRSDRVLVLGVERGGRLVQQAEDGGLAHGGARQGDALPLALREVHPTELRPQLGLLARGQLVDHLARHPLVDCTGDGARGIQLIDVADAHRRRQGDLVAGKVLEGGDRAAPNVRGRVAVIGETLYIVEIGSRGNIYK